MIHLIDLHFLGYAKAIASFLIETAEGPVLVETGPHSTLKALAEGVLRAGYQLEDIQHVFLTHIHLDHAGASWAFARHGAKIYVHPAGAPHLADPSKLMDSARRIYLDQMDALWGEMQPIPAAQLVTVNHQESFQIGGKTLVAHHTPGHAVHHIAWQLDNALFTGDVAGVRIMQGPVAPPCPPPDINLEDWLHSLALIEKLPVSVYYLTHFGPVTETATHLHDLKERLQAWAQWIRPKVLEQADPKAITPEFQQFVKEELLSKGISANDIAVYEAANPSWMSVAGLMRYWKKKGIA
jgi:glyoxylase-like metal-dependent hydrolase (beta-lactamase superfamily II)